MMAIIMAYIMKSFQKNIKKIFLISFIFLAISMVVLFFIPQNIAYAAENTNNYIEVKMDLTKETEYAKISDVKVYSKSDCNDSSYLFNVPTTAYLKIVDKPAENENFYHISYNGIDGYIQKSENATYINANLADFENKNIAEKGEYSNFSLNIIENLKNNQFELFLNATLAFVPSGISINEVTAIKYIGTRNDNTLCFNFNYNNQSLIGKANTQSFKTFNLPLHPIAQAKVDAMNTSKNTSTNKTADGSQLASIVANDKVVKTILIIGVSIPALLIIILIFVPNKKYRAKMARYSHRYDDRYDDDRYYDNRPPRRSKKHDYYDDDYRDRKHSKNRHYDDYDDRDYDYHKNKRSVRIYDEDERDYPESRVDRHYKEDISHRDDDRKGGYAPKDYRD